MSLCSQRTPKVLALYTLPPLCQGHRPPLTVTHRYLVVSLHSTRRYKCVHSTPLSEPLIISADSQPRLPYPAHLSPQTRYLVADSSRAAAVDLVHENAASRDSAQRRQRHASGAHLLEHTLISPYSTPRYSMLLLKAAVHCLVVIFSRAPDATRVAVPRTV